MKTPYQRKMLKAALVFLAVGTIAGVVLFTQNCAGGPRAFIDAGMAEAMRGYQDLHRPSGLHEVVVLERVEIHLVGDRSLFSWPVAAVPGSPIRAFATRDNQIWVMAVEDDGEIVFDEAAFLHEIKHLLAWCNRRFANPDTPR